MVAIDNILSRAPSTPMARLGLGLAALGRPGYMTLHHADDLEGRYDPSVMEGRAHLVLDGAYTAGIRYIDVARSYGSAEAFLASWIAARQLTPGAVAVASKWGYTYTAAWRPRAERHESKDHSLATLNRQLAESREQLGAHLSVYQIHSVTPESRVLHDDAVIDALARLRETGTRVGLTVSGAQQGDVIRYALTVRRDGECVFGVVQATWNLLERGAESALREAHDAGMMVVVKEALANGRLAAHSTDPAIASRLALLHESAVSTQATLDVVAIAAVLARPWADIVLSGAATVQQLRSNLAAASLRWSAELEGHLLPMAMSSAEYWRMRKSFMWH